MAEDKPDQDAVGDTAAEVGADVVVEQAEGGASAADVREAGGEGDDALSDPDALKAELEKAREDVLRAHADAQNTKRRAEQEVEKARKFALERFCSEMLPVVDNLERALESAAGEDEAIKPIAEGVELTLKGLLDTLRKFNIETLDPEGEPFDPNLHQAMSMVENDDVEPNSVLAVMQKGYTLNGRLLRPAMVMVSKAAES